MYSFIAKICIAPSQGDHRAAPQPQRADLNRPKIGVVSGERVLLRDDAYVSQGDVNAYGIKIEIFISSSNHKLYFDTGFKQM